MCQTLLPCYHITSSNSVRKVRDPPPSKGTDRCLEKYGHWPRLPQGYLRLASGRARIQIRQLVPIQKWRLKTNLRNTSCLQFEKGGTGCLGHRYVPTAWQRLLFRETTVQHFKQEEERPSIPALICLCLPIFSLTLWLALSGALAWESLREGLELTLSPVCRPRCPAQSQARNRQLSEC